MSERKIIKQVCGQKTIDGAGVHLVRVLDNSTVRDFDPFLMLDSFDSANPEDYLAGFPMHPHRGIETITYLISGEIEHKDSLGNKDTIRESECQWMTAGSGILHQEMPLESKRMLGIQLWLNLSKEEKMTEPAYLSITRDMIPAVKSGAADVRIISGTFENVSGITPRHIPATVYDISLPKNETITVPTHSDDNVFVFLIEGSAVIAGQNVPTKSAVLFGDGSRIILSAPPDTGLRFIFCSGRPLHESVAWGGPIVMNTREELELAFSELRQGTFIKHD